VSGSLTIPERLRGIPEAEDPGFFEMVEYFFHKAEISFEPVLRIRDILVRIRIRGSVPI
jgi:hypothetical protein